MHVSFFRSDTCVGLSQGIVPLVLFLQIQEKQGRLEEQSTSRRGERIPPLLSLLHFDLQHGLG